MRMRGATGIKRVATSKGFTVCLGNNHYQIFETIKFLSGSISTHISFSRKIKNVCEETRNRFLMIFYVFLIHVFGFQVFCYLICTCIFSRREEDRRGGGGGGMDRRRDGRDERRVDDRRGAVATESWRDRDR